MPFETVEELMCKMILVHFGTPFLNQVCIGQWLTCTWFLEIALVHDIGVCVRVRPQGYKLHSHDIEPVEQVCYV